ncbi:MAG: beta-ketoacyl synthase N-terminal-like domain-containing protein [Calditrichia bacterium]
MDRCRQAGIRTFDADAKGMVRTSGAAIVVLKRLSGRASRWRHSSRSHQRFGDQ